MLSRVISTSPTRGCSSARATRATGAPPGSTRPRGAARRSASAASGPTRSTSPSASSPRRAALHRAACPRSSAWPSAEGPVMTRVVRAGRVTFAALSVPNYRRYYGGQSISLIGTWMQMTAQAWLVLTLTHSSTALGVIVALQTLPVLLLAPYGGVIADRVDKRRMMIALQSAMGIQALILGAAHRDRRRAAVGDRRARRAARPQQRVREPRPPVVHDGDGRRRASAQRGQPQLRARQRRAHGRAGGGRAS